MIRNILDDDICEVEKIWYQESVRSHNWMDKPEKFWGKRLRLFRQNTVKDANIRYVFEENGIIKGFITGKNNHIWELFIRHEYQKNNIGSTLIKFLMGLKPLLIVNVYMLNHVAIKFYIKHDFVITKLYPEKETGFAKFLMEWKKES